MEATDYNFHVLTEINTNQDSALRRAGPTGYWLAQIDPHPGSGTTRAPANRQRTPRADVEHHRGCRPDGLLRSCSTSMENAAMVHCSTVAYDGHYGVIAPSG